jgi:hypothetical protein
MLAGCSQAATPAAKTPATVGLPHPTVAGTSLAAESTGAPAPGTEAGPGTSLSPGVGSQTTFPPPPVSVAAALPGPVDTRAAAGDLDATLACIRRWESGGDYATNTGNGYYGAYQSDAGTWAGYGGYERADLAPAAVQDAFAADLIAARGLAPWPTPAAERAA